MKTRREILHTAFGVVVAAYTSENLLAASDFWDKKTPEQWSEAEMERLKANSPWAQKVSLEVKGKASAASMDSNGTAGTFGGMHGADSNGISESRGRARGTGSAPTDQGQGPRVIVRWESAPPMLHATGWSLPSAFQDSYAVSVTGLPNAVVIMAVSGTGNTEGAPEDPGARSRTSVQRLLSGTTLAAKGHDPRNADFVVQSNDRASLIFGFAKTSQPFTVGDREIVFRMELGPVTIHAKFEPKAMTVNGQLAL